MIKNKLYYLPTFIKDKAITDINIFVCYEKADETMLIKMLCKLDLSFAIHWSMIKLTKTVCKIEKAHNNEDEYSISKEQMLMCKELAINVLLKGDRL